MDKLSRVIRQFTVSAGVFYAGQLCGLSSFDDPNSQTGHIHLLKQGRMTVSEKGQPDRELQGPALLFYPRPVGHTIKADDASNTEIVCASVHYGAGIGNPLAASLPSVICPSLTGDKSRLISTVEWLFEEAFSEQSARKIVMDRLCEILIVQLFRQAMMTEAVNVGLLAGLSHPQIAKALDAIHQRPEHNWSLNELAEIAVMSRSRFAQVFKDVTGNTPSNYHATWRIEVAKGLLRQDKPVGWVANEVGYDTASALARVFRKTTGLSPREWLHSQQA